jgi:predicted nucleic acid-binding protein
MNRTSELSELSPLAARLAGMAIDDPITNAKMPNPAPLAPAAVVLDTNVLLALWLFRDPVVEPLRAALARGNLRAVRSPATDAEFAEVLCRSDLFDVAAERQAALLADWQAASTNLDAIGQAPWTCSDPLDQKFLDLAVSAGAAWLITRDRRLLKLARQARRQGLAIVTPEEWRGRTDGRIRTG